MEPNTSLLRKAYTLLLLNLIPCPVTDPNSTGPDAEFGRNEAPLSVFLFHEKQTQTMQSAWKHNRSQPVGRVTHLRSWKEQDDKSRSYFFLHLFYYFGTLWCWPGQEFSPHVTTQPLSMLPAWHCHYSACLVWAVPTWSDLILQKMLMPIEWIPSTDMTTQFILMPVVQGYPSIILVRLHTDWENIMVK